MPRRRTSWSPSPPGCSKDLNFINMLVDPLIYLANYSYLLSCPLPWGILNVLIFMKKYIMEMSENHPSYPHGRDACAGCSSPRKHKMPTPRSILRMRELMGALRQRKSGTVRRHDLVLCLLFICLRLCVPLPILYSFSVVPQPALGTCNFLVPRPSPWRPAGHRLVHLLFVFTECCLALPPGPHRFPMPCRTRHLSLWTRMLDV